VRRYVNAWHTNGALAERSQDLIGHEKVAGGKSEQDLRPNLNERVRATFRKVIPEEVVYACHSGTYMIAL